MAASSRSTVGEKLERFCRGVDAAAVARRGRPGHLRSETCATAHGLKTPAAPGGFHPGRLTAGTFRAHRVDLHTAYEPPAGPTPQGGARTFNHGAWR